MPLKNISIILAGTLNSGNIGSVARAMKTMGLSRLKLVNPQCEIDEQAVWMATHGEDVLQNAECVSSIRDAVADATYVFGTTARSRKWRDRLTPEDMAQKVLSLGDHNRVALMFGPENSGLNNNDLELCNDVVTIPTDDNATSLNVSHAVMIVCYEIFKTLSQKDAPAKREKIPELAPSNKLEEMYDHMRFALLEIGYLDPYNTEHAIGNFRRVLTKALLTTYDVQLIRGVFRQLVWYIKHTKKTMENDTKG